MKKIILGLPALLLLFMPLVSAQECNSEFVSSGTPAARFFQTDEGMLVDLKTALMWQPCVAGLSGGQCETGQALTLSWQQAVKTVENLNQEPMLPVWRVPNIKELRSLVEYRCVDPALNLVLFPNAPSGRYWSSTSSHLTPGERWFVDFSHGQSNDADPAQHYYVRWVRDLLPQERTQ